MGFVGVSTEGRRSTGVRAAPAIERPATRKWSNFRAEKAFRRSETL